MNSNHIYSENLKAENPYYQKLFSSHEELEEKLGVLTTQANSQPEELVKLKKMKLNLSDKMRKLELGSPILLNT